MNRGSWDSGFAQGMDVRPQAVLVTVRDMLPNPKSQQTKPRCEADLLEHSLPNDGIRLHRALGSLSHASLLGSGSPKHWRALHISYFYSVFHKINRILFLPSDLLSSCLKKITQLTT